MSGPWDLLKAAGVPLGAPRAHADDPLDLEVLSRALAQVLCAELQPRERDALVAWLGALRAHWPTTHSALTSRMPPFEAGEVDPNRYLKLRRIALANLAGRL